MGDVVVRINVFTIYGYSLVLALSFLWGAFIFYKKANEAHFDDLAVLDTVVLSGFWSLVFGRIVFVFLHLGTFWNNLARVLFLRNYPGLDHWGLLLGLLTVIWYMARKSSRKFFDWMDLVAMSVVSAMGIFFAGLTILNFTWQTGVISIVSALMFIYLWRAERSYRIYNWYKNRRTEARPGYLTGVSLSFYGLIGMVMSYISVPRLLWAIIVNGLLFVSGFVLVYIRSGRVLSDDLKFISKHGKK